MRYHVGFDFKNKKQFIILWAKPMDSATFQRFSHIQTLIQINILAKFEGKGKNNTLTH